jgi:hypothetical protein
MKQGQINITLKKIEESKKNGCLLEALLANYHLNIEILKFISLKVNPGMSVKNVKPKEILNALILIVNNEHSSKAIINKKNLKILKPWLIKMDAFFKTLKIKNPSNIKNLILESEKIFSVLNISLSKIFIGSKP